MLGLLADLPRKNCWTIAEHAGDASPNGMQHLLTRAVWDADTVPDDVRGYVVDHLSDPEAVLVIDESGDLKKGTMTSGMQRQYTGTAGRVDNAQVGVYSSTPQRRARHDRPGAVCPPRSWTPRPVPLATLVRVAGQRWRVEEAFQLGEGLCGLDQHQLRRWTSWYRWMTLAVVALAFLVAAATLDRARHPTSAGLIPLTSDEPQHLFAALVIRPAADLGHRLRWSVWRRRHQYRARTCHYQRQATSNHVHHDLRLES